MKRKYKSKLEQKILWKFHALKNRKTTFMSKKLAQKSGVKTNEKKKRIIRAEVTEKGEGQKGGRQHVPDRIFSSLSYKQKAPLLSSVWCQLIV